LEKDQKVFLFLFNGPAPGAFTGPGIGFGSLPTTGKTFPVPQTTITTEIGKALNIHPHLAPTVTFDHIQVINNFTNIGNNLFIQIIAIRIVRQINLIQDLSGS
jgi:hypothetical protein